MKKAYHRIPLHVSVYLRYRHQDLGISGKDRCLDVFICTALRLRYRVTIPDQGKITKSYTRYKRYTYLKIYENAFNIV